MASGADGHRTAPNNWCILRVAKKPKSEWDDHHEKRDNEE